MRCINKSCPAVERLFGDSKPHTIIADIKDSIVSSDEHITENPHRADIWRQINTYETTQTLCLSFNINLDTKILVTSWGRKATML